MMVVSFAAAAADDDDDDSSGALHKRKANETAASKNSLSRSKIESCTLQLFLLRNLIFLASFLTTKRL
jgi:hypothetical protein